MSEYGLNDPDCCGKCEADKFGLVRRAEPGCPAHDRPLDELDAPSRELREPGFRYCPRDRCVLPAEHRGHCSWFGQHGRRGQKSRA